MHAGFVRGRRVGSVYRRSQRFQCLGDVAFRLPSPRGVVTWIVTWRAGSQIHPVGGAGDPSGHSALGRGARPPPDRARPRADTVGRQLAPKYPVVIHVAPSRPAQEPLPTQHSTPPWENNGMSHLGPGSGADARRRVTRHPVQDPGESHLTPDSGTLLAEPVTDRRTRSSSRTSDPAQEPFARRPRRASAPTWRGRTSRPAQEPFAGCRPRTTCRPSSACRTSRPAQ